MRSSCYNRYTHLSSAGRLTDRTHAYDDVVDILVKQELIEDEQYLRGPWVGPLAISEDGLISCVLERWRQWH